MALWAAAPCCRERINCLWVAGPALFRRGRCHPHAVTRRSGPRHCPQMIRGCRKTVRVKISANPISIGSSGLASGVRLASRSTSADAVVRATHGGAWPAVSEMGGSGGPRKCGPRPAIPFQSFGGGLRCPQPIQVGRLPLSPRPFETSASSRIPAQLQCELSVGPPFDERTIHPVIRFPLDRPLAHSAPRNGGLAILQPGSGEWRTRRTPGHRGAGHEPAPHRGHPVASDWPNKPWTVIPPQSTRLPRSNRQMTIADAAAPTFALARGAILHGHT